MISVYVLRSLISGKRYVGTTDSIPRRLNEHWRPGSTVFKLPGAFEVLQEELFANYVEARVREKFLKSGQGRAWLDRKYPV